LLSPPTAIATAFRFLSASSGCVISDDEDHPVVRLAELYPVALLADLSPVALLADLSPVALLAELSPVALLAELYPVALLADLRPVALLAELSPVALLADLSPVACSVLAGSQRFVMNSNAAEISPGRSIDALTVSEDDATFESSL